MELRDHSVIIFMLPDLGFIADAAAPLLAAWRAKPPAPGTVVVVMSSVSPQAVQQFGADVVAASAGNAAVVDAPVSGGTVGARNGTLAIMAGGTQKDFGTVRPVLDSMGTTVRLLGGLGAGSLAKACNQLLVGTTTAALAEAAELAERSGMDVAALFEVLGGGLAGSAVLDIVGPADRRQGLRAHRACQVHAQGSGVCAGKRGAAGVPASAGCPWPQHGHALYGTLQGTGRWDDQMDLGRGRAGSSIVPGRAPGRPKPAPPARASAGALGRGPKPAPPSCLGRGPSRAWAQPARSCLGRCGGQ